EHFTRIAIEINEARLREDLRQKWNPKRILRRLFEHANAARWRRRTVPIAQQLIKAIAQCGDDFRTRVTFAETGRVEVRGENATASHAFDDAVALTANSVDVGGLCQCFEQQRRAGARRVDDEDRALKTRINRSGNNVRGAYGRRRD